MGAGLGQLAIDAMGWLWNFPAKGMALQLWFGERIPRFRRSRTPGSGCRADRFSPSDRTWVEPSRLRFKVAPFPGTAGREVLATALLRARPGFAISHRLGHSVPSSSLPHGAFKPPAFYLIHAPRAFYAIKQVFRTSSGSTECRVAFDRKDFQFFCPGTGLRWDRVGRPVGARADEEWSLSLVPATVAHDGHILFCPFFGGVLGVDLKGNPWA